MAFIFRKSMKIAPGLRVNLSKSGASVSLGTKGARLTASKRGVTTTTGLPGTGLSNREFKSWDNIYKARETAKRIDRSNEERAAFTRHPFIMVLSAVLLGLAVLSIIIPPIPFWAFFPCLLGAIVLYGVGVQSK